MPNSYNKSYRWQGGLTTILSAQGAAGAGTAVDVSQFKSIQVYLSTDGGANADLTVKALGSIEDTEPTWASAASRSNQLFEIGLWRQPGSTLDQSVETAAADVYRAYTLNVDGIKWLNFIVSLYVAGDVTVKIRGYNNQ